MLLSGGLTVIFPSLLISTVEYKCFCPAAVKPATGSAARRQDNESPLPGIRKAVAAITCMRYAWRKNGSETKPEP